MLKHILLYSLRRLKVRVLTTVLTVIGVAVAVANILALISVAEIARAQAVRLITELGANTIFVTPYFELETSPFEQSGVAATALPLSFVDFFKDKSYVETYSPILALPAYAGFRDKRIFTNVIGTRPALFDIRPYKLKEGRFMTEEEADAGAAATVLAHTVAQKLFPQGNAVGNEIVIKGQKYKVVGTLEEKGKIGFEDFDNRVFIPLKRAQSVFEFPYVHVIAIKHKEKLNTEKVVEEIKRELASWLGVDAKTQDDFQVFSMKELTRAANETFEIFAVILLAVSLIALVVAGILIMVVMLMSVVDQTREIGIRKAVGAKRQNIVAQFLTEALILVFVGQILGLILGIFGVYLLCLKVDWAFFLSPKTVILALLFSLLAGVIFAVGPAWQAARLDPVQSLRYE